MELFMEMFGLTQVQAEILTAVLIVVGTVILAKIINVIFTRVVKKLTAKTKTTVDDRFIANVRKPIMLLAALVGLNYGLKYITSISQYYGTIDLVLSILFIFICAKLALEVFELVFGLYLEKIAPKTKSEMDNQLMPVIRNVIKIFVYVVAVILIIGKLGYDIAPMLAGLGIAGLAVALALQNTLSSFFAGFYIIADKPIRKGDFVKLASGESGHIESIGWRTTRIKALKNYIIVVPNTKLIETIVYNYDLPQKDMSILLNIGVDYKSNIDKVEKILKEEAKKIQKKHKGTVPSFDAVVRFDNFSDYSLDFKVILRIKSYTEQWAVAADFKKALFQRFKKARIGIPFPTQTIYLEK